MKIGDLQELLAFTRSQLFIVTGENQKGVSDILSKWRYIEWKLLMSSFYWQK